MKITLTGSLGRIGKHIATTLIAQGHTVTVISSDAEKQKVIESLGARAAIGSIEDPQFLTTSFTGADAVYLMEPPVNFFDQQIDLYEYYNNIARVFVQAVQGSGVKKLVHLSSIGGHTDTGVGMLKFHFGVEAILRQLPADVAISILRPVGFYYNLFAFIPGIKTRGAIISNYGGDQPEPWVSPLDIAAVAVEELTQPLQGRKIRYIASDEVSPNQTARILGAAIGKPDLQWTAIPDEQLLQGLLAAGMNAQAAKGFVEMNAARVDGSLYADYNKHKPTLGKVKLTDFAKDFAAAYSSK